MALVVSWWLTGNLTKRLENLFSAQQKSLVMVAQDDFPILKCVATSQKLPPPANLHKAIAIRLAAGMAFHSLMFLLEISGETRLTN